MKKVFIYGERKTWINYAEAIEGCGGTVVFSENIEDSADCDMLLLTGGADINPALYGQENTKSEGIDDKRDEDEFKLIDIFTEKNKPILGICRGHQIITVKFGGTLIQDVNDVEKHSRNGKPYDKTHIIEVHSNSFLYPLYGEKFSVNSSHHQAAETIPNGFKIDAMSDDNVIEAISCKERNIYGVQFHPERMSFMNLRDDTVDGKAIFSFFLNL